MGLPRHGSAAVHVGTRPQRRRDPRDVEDEERAAVDARLPSRRLPPLPRAREPVVGRQPRAARRDRLRQYPLLRPCHGQGLDELGRRPGVHQEHLRQAGHPGGGAEVPRRRRRAVRLRGRLPQHPRGPREAGRALPRHGPGARGAPGDRRGVLRHDHPARRQQVRRAELRGVVRRLVHLRAEGREGRHPAPGLLPHQHREHGPVRADADHRGRGLAGALRRGLHGPDLQHRVAALGGRGDRREEGRARPLHDDPELVEQRLQPRDEARLRVRGRRSWSGSTATSAPCSR